MSSIKDRWEGLSPAQQKVVRVVVLRPNLAYIDVGRVLSLSVHTVRTHVRVAFARLQVHTRQEMFDLLYEFLRTLPAAQEVATQKLPTPDNPTGQSASPEAACRDNPDAQFVVGAAQQHAKKVCQRCPIRVDCLVEALNNNIEHGVWGGKTARERRAVRKAHPNVVWKKRQIIDAAPGNG